MLKYLFTASFSDGTIYTQNDSDISTINPTKSCFFDILEYEKGGKKLDLFCLSDEDNLFVVDLKDGHFEIGHNVNIPPPKGIFSDMRLIYFRRISIFFENGVKSDQNMVFHLGWQATNENGQNIQHLMEVV